MAKNDTDPFWLITPEEIPFEIPEGWEWVRLDEIVDICGGITKGRKLDGKEVVSVPYLRVANVQAGFLDLEEIKEIDIPLRETSKYQLEDADLLITEGGDWDKVGRTAIWREEIPVCVHQNHVFRARKILTAQSETWLETVLNAPPAKAYFARSSKQTTNLASINKTQLRSCPIPLPPIAHQAIIEKLLSNLGAMLESVMKSGVRCDQTQRLISAGSNVVA